MINTPLTLFLSIQEDMMKKIYFILMLLLPLTMCSKAPEGQKVLIETSMGNIKVVLYDDTPLHSHNFAQLVEEGYYDGLNFHRVIQGFMIQAGKTRLEKDSILNEELMIAPEVNTAKHIHKAGTLAAARWPDEENPKKMSDKHQFYIVTGKAIWTADFQSFKEERMEDLKYKIFKDLPIDEAIKDSIKHQYYTDGFVEWNRFPTEISSVINQESEKRKGEILEYTQAQKDTYLEVGGTPHLDGDFTVFGEVYEGLEIVKKIEIVETTPNDAPIKPVIIKNITLIKE